MARTKQFKKGKGGKIAVVAQQFKKRLTTKRNSLSKTSSRFSTSSRSSSISSKDEPARFSLPATLNQSSNVSSLPSTSQDSRLALSHVANIGEAYYARKSIIASNTDDDTLSHGNARKAMKSKHSRSLPSKPLRRSARKSEIENAVNTIEPETSLQIFTTKSPKKGKKVKRVFVARHIEKRRKRGMLALQEIRYYQKRADLLLRKLPFQRLVKEILHGTIGKGEYRIQKEAILALQEVAEMYLVDMFERCQLSALHAKRITIFNRDISLLKALDTL